MKQWNLDFKNSTHNDKKNIVNYPQVVHGAKLAQNTSSTDWAGRRRLISS